MGVRLRTGETEQRFAVSQTPCDSLEELAAAMCGFLETGRAGVARFCCEPEEVDLAIVPGRRQGEVRVAVTRYPDHRRTMASGRPAFAFEGPGAQVGQAIWRALRHVEPHLDSRHWQWSFPASTVLALGRQLEVAPFERVHAVIDYIDDVVEGVADFEGRPHHFRRVFDTEADEYRDVFELRPMDEETFAEVLRAREASRQGDEAAMSTVSSRFRALPALPAPIVAAEFSGGAGGDWSDLEVSWTRRSE